MKSRHNIIITLIAVLILAASIIYLLPAWDGINVAGATWHVPAGTHPMRSSSASADSLFWSGRREGRTAWSTLDLVKWKTTAIAPPALAEVLPPGTALHSAHVRGRQVQCASFRVDAAPAERAPVVHGRMTWLRVLPAGQAQAVDAHYERIDGDDSLDPVWDSLRSALGNVSSPSSPCTS